MQLDLNLCEVLPVGEVREWFFDPAVVAAMLDHHEVTHARLEERRNDGWEADEAPVVERREAREWSVSLKLGDQSQVLRVRAPSGFVAGFRARALLIECGEGLWRVEGVERLQ